jgi:hypothetical protein
MSDLIPAEPPIEAEPIGDAVHSTRLRALLRYWAEKSAGRAMPFRQQIEPTEIPRLLPIALLADVTGTGARMRLLGSEATAACGKETRGAAIAEIQFGDFTVSWLDTFFRVIQSGKPACAAGTYRRGNELCRIETVLMPLTEDGSSVSQIFGGLLIRPILTGRIVGRSNPIDFSTNSAGKMSGGPMSRGTDSKRASP